MGRRELEERIEKRREDFVRNSLLSDEFIDFVQEDCAQISSALDERMQKVRDVIMQAEEKEEEKSSGVEPLMLRGLTERIRQKTF